MVFRVFIALFAGLILVSAAPPAAAQEPRTARPLCNEYLRQLGGLMAAQPDHPRMRTVEVFRTRASILCRQGRRGEGQLYLQSAIRVMGAEPVGGADFLDAEIAKREARRRELIERRIIDPE